MVAGRVVELHLDLEPIETAREAERERDRRATVRALRARRPGASSTGHAVARRDPQRRPRASPVAIATAPARARSTTAAARHGVEVVLVAAVAFGDDAQRVVGPLPARAVGDRHATVAARPRRAGRVLEHRASVGAPRGANLARPGRAPRRDAVARAGRDPGARRRSAAAPEAACAARSRTRSNAARERSRRATARFASAKSRSPGAAASRSSTSSRPRARRLVARRSRSRRPTKSSGRPSIRCTAPAAGSSKLARGSCPRVHDLRRGRRRGASASSRRWNARHAPAREREVELELGVDDAAARTRGGSRRGAARRRPVRRARPGRRSASAAADRARGGARAICSTRASADVDLVVHGVDRAAADRVVRVVLRAPRARRADHVAAGVAAEQPEPRRERLEVARSAARSFAEVRALLRACAPTRSPGAAAPAARSAARRGGAAGLPALRPARARANRPRLPISTLVSGSAARRPLRGPPAAPGCGSTWSLPFMSRRVGMRDDGREQRRTSRSSLRRRALGLERQVHRVAVAVAQVDRREPRAVRRLPVEERLVHVGADAAPEHAASKPKPAKSCGSWPTWPNWSGT